MMSTFMLYSVVALLASIVACRMYAFLRRWGSTEQVVGFFHPFCNSGGGGERVLWLCITALQALHPRTRPLRCLIYTGDNVKPAQILDKARVRGPHLPVGAGFPWQVLFQIFLKLTTLRLGHYVYAPD
jgi:hypothetical protein